MNKESDDQYTEKEPERRPKAALKRALNTPHKPHEPLGKTKVKRKPSKRGKKP